jgi:hypothetical protein
MDTHGNGHMSDYFFDVDFVSYPFKADVKLSMFSCKEHEQERITVFNKAVDFIRLLNDDLRSQLSACGFYISHALVFNHRTSYFKQPPHRDASGQQFTYSLNWIFCDGDCEYRWYEENLGISPDVGKNSVGVTYVRYALEDIALVESTTSKGPLIMNTQAIHSGVNLSDSERTSVCVRFTNTFDSMNDIKQHMISHSMCK